MNRLFFNRFSNHFLVATICITFAAFSLLNFTITPPVETLSSFSRWLAKAQYEHEFNKINYETKLKQFDFSGTRKVSQLLYVLDEMVSKDITFNFSLPYFYWDYRNQSLDEYNKWLKANLHDVKMLQQAATNYGYSNDFSWNNIQLDWTKTYNNDDSFAHHLDLQAIFPQQKIIPNTAGKVIFKINQDKNYGIHKRQLFQDWYQVQNGSKPTKLQHAFVHKDTAAKIKNATTCNFLCLGGINFRFEAISNGWFTNVRHYREVKIEHNAYALTYFWNSFRIRNKENLLSILSADLTKTKVDLDVKIDGGNQFENHLFNYDLNNLVKVELIQDKHQDNLLVFSLNENFNNLDDPQFVRLFPKLFYNLNFKFMFERFSQDGWISEEHQFNASQLLEGIRLKFVRPVKPTKNFLRKLQLSAVPTTKINPSITAIRPYKNWSIKGDHFFEKFNDGLVLNEFPRIKNFGLNYDLFHQYLPSFFNDKRRYKLLFKVISDDDQLINADYFIDSLNVRLIPDDLNGTINLFYFNPLTRREENLLVTNFLSLQAIFATTIKSNYFSYQLQADNNLLRSIVDDFLPEHFLRNVKLKIINRNDFQQFLKIEVRAEDNSSIDYTAWNAFFSQNFLLIKYKNLELEINETPINSKTIVDETYFWQKIAVIPPQFLPNKITKNDFNVRIWSTKTSYFFGLKIKTESFFGQRTFAIKKTAAATNFKAKRQDKLSNHKIALITSGVIFACIVFSLIVFLCLKKWWQRQRN